jgi:hypothetical protein
VFRVLFLAMGASHTCLASRLTFEPSTSPQGASVGRTLGEAAGTSSRLGRSSRASRLTWGFLFDSRCLAWVFIRTLSRERVLSRTPLRVLADSSTGRL